MQQTTCLVVKLGADPIPVRHQRIGQLDIEAVAAQVGELGSHGEVAGFALGSAVGADAPERTGDGRGV